MEGGFVFNDGLKYTSMNVDEQWDYCSQSDPRFHSEIELGIQLGDSLTLTSPNPEHHALPPGCYDTVDGYYDPRRQSVISYTTNQPIRTPDAEEVKWITKYCRVGVE